MTEPSASEPSDQQSDTAFPSSSSSSSNNGEKKYAQLDTADTDWARWKNWTNSVLGRFDDTTLLDYASRYDDYHEATDIARCEKYRDWLLKWSPQIRFTQEKIRKLGGDLHVGNIRCMKCTAVKGSGFDPDYGIQLCANRIKTRGLLEDCMAHGRCSYVMICPMFAFLCFSPDKDVNGLFLLGGI